MPEFDLLIRGADPFPEIGIADGKIVSFANGSAREEIDATGLHVFPGVIDSHVHFNEPGRADWEGLETGSRALAAGGGTLFFDMPLNAHPPTCDAASFDLKLVAAQKKSLTDFAFWGGLVPGNLDKMAELAARRDWFQGVHVEQRHRRFFLRGRRDVARRHEARGAVKITGRRSCRK